MLEKEMDPLGFGEPILDTPEGVRLCGCRSISRYLARETLLVKGSCGCALQSAQIDGWLEFSDVLIRVTQGWALPVMFDTPVPAAALRQARADLRRALGVLDAHLTEHTFLVGERVSLADYAVLVGLHTLFVFVVDPGFKAPFHSLNRWFATVAAQPDAAAVIGPIEFCRKGVDPKVIEAAKEEAPKAAEAPKTEAPKAAEAPKPKSKPKKKAKDDDEEEEDDFGIPKEEAPKEPNPLSLLPPSKFVLNDWKVVYSNQETREAIKWLWGNYDPEGYSLWFCRYKYEHEAPQVFMVANGLTGWIQRLDPLRKWGFGSLLIFGKEKPFEVEGLWLFRGKDIPKEMLDCDDSELYDWERADPEKDRERIEEFLLWEGKFGGRTFNQGKIYK